MSNTPHPIEALVRSRSYELELPPTELVRRAGYKNVAKDLRRLDELFSGSFDGARGLIASLPAALDLPEATIQQAIEDSRRQIAEAKEAAWLVVSCGTVACKVSTHSWPHPQIQPWRPHMTTSASRPALAANLRDMNFIDAIKSCFSKYATFEGRACRSEYWFFLLFQFLIGFSIAMVEVMSQSGNADPATPIANLTSLAMVLPTFAVLVRRLHDIDRSGWWLLIGFVPLIGGITMLVFCCMRGTEGSNRFGADPLSPTNMPQTSAPGLAVARP